MISEKEFTIIVRQTKGVVLSAIRASLPPRFYESIDDIVQETYVRAFNALAKGSFRNESKIETWLYRIARNETLRETGKLIREEKKAVKSVKDDVSEKYSDDDGVSLNEVRSFVNRLPDAQKSVFDLVLEGMNESEISDLLRIPKGTVKSRISRGRVLLNRMKSEAMK